jgi:hypothetical protein
MASQPRMREREEARRLSVRTLAVASAASFVAAIVTSQFSTVGTPIAAALTPVIVTLVSELLHRPTELIAQRVTRETEALPEAGGPAPPPPPEADRLPERAPAEPEITPAPPPGPREGPQATPVRVYRQRPAPSRRRRRIAVGVVATTALLAFAIAAAALTVPELIGGGSITGDRDTTLFGGRDRKEPERPEEELSPQERPPEQPQEQDQQRQPPTQRQTETEEDRTETTDQTTTEEEPPPGPTVP